MTGGATSPRLLRTPYEKKQGSVQRRAGKGGGEQPHEQPTQLWSRDVDGNGNEWLSIQAGISYMMRLAD